MFTGTGFRHKVCTRMPKAANWAVCDAYFDMVRYRLHSVKHMETIDVSHTVRVHTVYSVSMSIRNTLSALGKTVISLGWPVCIRHGLYVGSAKQ